MLSQYKRYNHSVIVELRDSYHRGYSLIKSLMDYGRDDSIIFGILDSVIHMVCAILSEYNKRKVDINDITQNVLLLSGDSYTIKLKEAVSKAMMELSAIGILLTLVEGVGLVSKIESAIIDDLCTQIPDLNTEYIKVNDFIYLGNMTVKLNMVVNRD